MIELVLTTREQDTFEAALAWQIEEFQRQRPDVRITVQPRPIHDHYVAMVEQGGAADVDLFLCCTDWLPDAAAQGLLTPLDELFAAAPLPDWPDAWHPAMQKLVVQQGQLVGLPWHDGPEVFMVRTDLFED
ncbi:MAG: extracellular solute-binding protein, partial [Fimbriimonadaceae bacterium]